MQKAYRFRLYPTDGQIQQMTKVIGCCRLVWNRLLEYSSKSYERRKGSHRAFDLNNFISHTLKPAEFYNASNDNAVIDDRSGKKGPEPESIAYGVVDGRAYVFLALEMTGGIMAYDVSNHDDVEFAGYINTRDFRSIVPGSEEWEDGEIDKWVTGGDVAPEGLCFIDASSSPTGEALLLSANEVSGTVAVYTLG